MVGVPSYLPEMLTREQREAVLHYGSPLLIIAGPGSGKTEVISSRAVHFIQTGYAQPENLLATTFTNKAALELKDRIQRLRAILACGIAYFILPVDVIPEEIYGPYGYIDDIYMCAWVGKTVSEALGDAAIIRQAWHGEGDIVAIIDEILAKQHELVAEAWPKIVQYVGFDALTG